MTPEIATPSRWTDQPAYLRWCQRPLGRAFVHSVRRRLAPWLGAARGRVVDIGCGPALNYLDLIPAACEVVAVDCSASMALWARRRMEEIRPAGRVLVGSIEQLPLQSGCADLVLCMNCLEFVADRARALRELHRVSAPGASAVLGVMNRAGFWETSRRWRRPLSRAPYYRGRFLSVEELTEAAAQAGWRALASEHAVGFPPLPLPSPGCYEWLERRLPPRRGGVALLLAQRPD
ncbi:MAG: class I SAM-dependent methyltransferase [Planctomycetota bacterium]|nr:MAG: class I SAM-dependent methyltransferase [Planctomycetota bacterium]